jgi:predicted 3-demethylubiquinone-9 3-methyltransferase (glyoxalase superfamily)
MACGWLTDKYGVTWQITPERLDAMINDPDKAKAERAMNAMMGMVKLDIAALERAWHGK